MAAVLSWRVAASARHVSSTIAILAIALVLASVAIVSVVPGAAADPAPTLLWQRYPGTVQPDYADGVAIDSVGDIIVGGSTAGSLGRVVRPNPWNDGYIIKYSATGEVKWRRQPRTSTQDAVFGLAIDPADNIVAVGYTYGRLADPNQGLADGFIVKYAADGTRLWQHQAGTTGDDFFNAVATDTAGNIFVVGDGGDVNQDGVSLDAFLIKYSFDGKEQWRRVLASTDGDHLEGIAIAPNGDIVVVGYTYGSLGSPNKGSADIIVARYSASGRLQWLHQSGAADGDFANAVAIGAGQVFVVGLRSCCTSSNKEFVAAFSADDGEEQWLREADASRSGTIKAVATDASGNALVSGTAQGEAFVASYTPDGTVQWTQPIRSGVSPRAAVTDNAGSLAITGTVTRGGVARGYLDGWVARYQLP